MGHGYESEHGSSYDEVEEGDPLKDKLKFKKDLLVGLKNLKKSKLTALKSKLGKKDKKDKKDKCEIIWEEQKQPHCATQYEEVSWRLIIELKDRFLQICDLYGWAFFSYQYV